MLNALDAARSLLRRVLARTGGPVGVAEGGDGVARTDGADGGADLGDFGELQDLLDEIGAEAAPPDGEALLARKDATIAELQRMLLALQPAGERLPHEELARVSAEEHAAELVREIESLRRRLATTEAELAAAQAEADDSVEAELRAHAAALQAELAEETAEAGRLRAEGKRLERRLHDREAVLARERERHAATREKLAEKKRVAAERWTELRRLRQRLKDA